MTPKEEAKQIFDSMHFAGVVSVRGSMYAATKGKGIGESKHCALIAVDKVIEVLKKSTVLYKSDLINFYEEVKKEILNL
jgi:hypothetical protein